MLSFFFLTTVTAFFSRVWFPRVITRARLCRPPPSTGYFCRLLLFGFALLQASRPLTRWPLLRALRVNGMALAQKACDEGRVFEVTRPSALVIRDASGDSLGSVLATTGMCSLPSLVSRSALVSTSTLRRLLLHVTDPHEPECRAEHRNYHLP